LTNTTVEDKEVGNEPLTRLEIASVCLLVELGVDPIDAYNLIYDLKEFSPQYHRRVLECTGLYVEARSALINLLREIDRTRPLDNRPSQETLKIPHGGESITKANIQTRTLEKAENLNLQQVEKPFNEKAEKIEETVEKPSEEKTEEKILEKLHGMASEQAKVGEKILEKLRGITNEEETDNLSQVLKEKTDNLSQEVEEETVNVPQEVKEDILAAEQVPMPESTSQEIDLENREEVEKWLRNIESHFEEMPVEMQEETMPRYIQLRTHICKDKIVTDSSCIGCLIGNTIDCPLFSRNSKKMVTSSKKL
jgi:hypothetical protein